MAATVARLQAVLSADTRDFDRGMDRSESKIKKYGKVAALGLGAAGAAGAVAFLKKGWDELAESQKVAAQTEAVLKSTGGAANVTAGQVDKLATSLMRKSGIDDEQIKSGQNMLLTFTRIRNEVGQGNDIFNQATKATLDLSVAMGKDMQSSAILVGKALNDPIKGMTALGRAGIQFTEDQKETIKALVATGKTMDAQKIILAELETQFGGSAEAVGKTLPGQLAIARESFNNFAGDIVARIIPKVAQFVNFIRDHWPEIRQTIVNTWVQVKPTFDALIDIVQLVAATVQKHWDTIERNFNALKTIVVDALKIVRDAIQLVNALLHGEWGEAWKNAKEIVENVIHALKTYLTNQVENILQLARALGRAVFNGFKEGITGIGEFLLSVLGGLRDMLVNQAEWIGHAAMRFGVRIKDGIVDGVTGLGQAIWELIKAIPGFLVDKIAATANEWLSIGTAIKDAIVDGLAGLGRALFDKVKDEVTSIPGRVWGTLNPFGDGGGQSGIDTPGGGNFPMPTTGRGNLMGALPVMQPFADAAARYGLVVTSGLRPGAITANGTPSDHGFGKALDVSNGVNTPQMAAFFRSLIGNPNVKQAFYDPIGSIFGGVLSSYREGGHSDHVHVATYDKGGWLKPGLTLAYNGLGRPERVGGGDTVVIPVTIGDHLLATVVFDMNRRQARIFENRNSRPAFGGGF